MDCIALPIYHLAKFVHKHTEEQSRTCSRVDSRIEALIVMYQYFQDQVTRVEKERKSMVAAARKGMEKKSSRKSLPNGFKFNPRMVSQQWLDDGSTMAQPRLGIPTFGSDFWDPHRKRNSNSVFDSEDSGRDFFLKFGCLESQKIRIPICEIRNSGNLFAQELSM